MNIRKTRIYTTKNIITDIPREKSGIPTTLKACK